MLDILIKNANQGNLKHVNIRIPKQSLCVLCGVSGSGKSTLAIDVLFQECQRQYLEAMGMQGIQKPDVEEIRNVSPALLIKAKAYANQPRSSLGTITNIYTDLRMIYEKLSIRECPVCHQRIAQMACREECEKDGEEFHVSIYCEACGHKIDKLTRSHFSFHTREGACETCHGLGYVYAIDETKLIDETKTLKQGAIAIWEHRYLDYMIEILKKMFAYYHIEDVTPLPLNMWSYIQKRMLFYGVEDEKVKQAFPDIKPPKNTMEGKMEGLFPSIHKKIAEAKGIKKQLEPYIYTKTCPDCGGDKLQKYAREAIVHDATITSLTRLTLEELASWVIELEDSLSPDEKQQVDVYLLDLKTKINRLQKVGLGYLQLERQTSTLSGGEAQRMQLAAALDSELTGILYVLDEPTRGLHPQDSQGVIDILKAMRDKGNTMLVIEHDVDVLKESDYIIEVGPQAGNYGGSIIARGTYEEIMQHPDSIIKQYMQEDISNKEKKRPDKFMWIKDACAHNLKHVDACFALQAFNVVTGVSGSGKSTLVFDELAKQKERLQKEYGFDQIIQIRQQAITTMKRSNVATYIHAYDEIRKLYASQPLAKAKGFTSSTFSFNSKGGRCERCEGMGTIKSNLLFFEDIEIVCPLCHGAQFEKEVLQIKYKGYSIHELLKQSVEEAFLLFKDNRKLYKIFSLMKEAGLGYLMLHQPMTSLSSGELQRLQFVKEILDTRGKKRLYLLDEPTIGLHPQDVNRFLDMLTKMKEAGNTLIVVEHNLQVIREADWIADLGPQGGNEGGQVLVCGQIQDVCACEQSITGQFLEVK
ncbi:AAA family ATPase [Absiella sp. AM29-15]|uniref:AAA family ATPase n=1 Tax=Absiella sp. AM29-15 TaxID=2292278 RepID=UPI000E4112F9|nr:excinuclease ABC subunit UvrA [Absiella sp. AM29-15]RGC50137.1 excinuclease ABC subunit UvrA [Absiella sp. AM29-15]